MKAAGGWIWCGAGRGGQARVWSAVRKLTVAIVPTAMVWHVYHLSTVTRYSTEEGLFGLAAF